MNLVSAPFLFLFLPAAVVIYYLIPAKKDLGFRNLFLFFAGLFFYTWGEPVFVFLLLGMIFLTRCFGKMAYEKKGTRIGKTAVALTVITNLSVLLIFGKLEFIISILSRLFGKDFSVFLTDLPIGFSFFAFSSISYVVDIYRGQVKSSGSFFQAALYTGAFFKILQGPIISFRRFNGQISERPQSFDLIGKGIWRFSIGLCKKIIIADNLSLIVQQIQAQNYADVTPCDAWLRCITYLVYLYFDFSGYSDMAIGLAEIFGYSIPENFNYPYLATSVSEFWRRFHITLCAWFTEYLYYPILLGPSIRFRKHLQRHRVPAKTAKAMQNILVTASVWSVTALWHGLNLNYAVWGLLNCAGMLIEPHIKPLKNKRLNSSIRRAGMLGFLFMSVPLISTDSFNEALLFYRAMFSGAFMFSDSTLLLINEYGVYLLAGIIGCFPVLPHLKNKFFRLTNEKYHGIWNICAGILLFVLVITALSFLFTRDTVYFLYQN